MQVDVKDRVLLVDDEPQILVALEDVLSEKFVVFKADSGESALNVLARERNIAVVVTDQRMPRMTGDQLLASLTPSFDASRIMVTGFADLSAVIRAVNDGRIFAYVTKPWNPDDLRLKVAKAAEHFRLVKEIEFERQLLHDMMDNIPDGIYFKGRDLRFLRANRAFASIVGAGSAEDLVGKRSVDIALPRPDVQATEGEEMRILQEGVPALDVVREYQNGHAGRWFSETKAAIRNKDGQIMGLVGIARDVTERVETARALESSETRYRKQSQILNSILDSMGEGVVVTDPAGRFVLFNRQAKTILGVGMHDALPVKWAEIYGTYLPDRKTPVAPDQHPLVRAMKGEEVRDMELFVKNEVGSGVMVAVTATPLKYEETGGTGAVALVRDVTEQRRLEEQLLQAQKMEAIGQLAGGVAHDFNNLLLVMQSCAEFVLQDLPEGDKNREDMGEILAATRRASSLTRQLLAFSRRQASQPKALDLNEVVANVEGMLRRLIGENVDLVTSLSPALGIVRADAGQLEQVIVNLTVNARDAMPEGGKLTIETCNVELTAEDVAIYPGVSSGAHVVLSVSDTGTGIDAATQKRIFEPFFTTKEVGKGTGLGLSTVYGIVQQSGGHLRVQSELQHGTCFKVYLPRVDAVTDIAQPRRPRTIPVKGAGTILLVEDDEAVRHVAARILRENGYTVLETRRPSEALSVCAESKTPIDLLLTDIVMPETSGPKLAEELSARYPSLRVLYMSGYSGVAPTSTRSIAADAGYIEKPFAASALAEKVRQAMRGNG
ncbi:MAG TPA: response regulator [Polyangiaceae bacterium]|nr:response regulator [Polyangiaceae bacterium]